LTPRWEDLHAEENPMMLHRTAYSRMLGWRLKRIREGRHLSQGQVARNTRRPSGGCYSQGFISRIEGGYMNAPLYGYTDLAQFYDIDPARLMGPKEDEKPVGEAEMTLLRFLRRLGITADEAMARIAKG
jgi:transcriptional regulator with XRE-family HTH domain